MRDHRRLISFMLVVAAFAVSAVAFPHLPEAIPTHWGTSGKPDQFGSRLQAALTLPLVMLGLRLLFGFVPRYDRLLFINYDVRDSDLSAVHPVYDLIVAIVLALLLAIHVFAISSAIGLVGLIGVVAVPSSPLKPLFVALMAQAIIVMIYSYRLAHSSAAP